MAETQPKGVKKNRPQVLDMLGNIGKFQPIPLFAESIDDVAIGQERKLKTDKRGKIRTFGTIPIVSSEGKLYDLPVGNSIVIGQCMDTHAGDAVALSYERVIAGQTTFFDENTQTERVHGEGGNGRDGNYVIKVRVIGEQGLRSATKLRLTPEQVELKISNAPEESRDAMATLYSKMM